MTSVTLALLLHLYLMFILGTDAGTEMYPRFQPVFLVLDPSPPSPAVTFPHPHSISTTFVPIP